MSPRRRNTLLGGLGIVVLVALVTAAAYLLVPTQPPGPWPKEQRDAFIDSCNQKCRSSPGVTPDRYALCDKACTCGADEAERTVSSAELARIVMAQKVGMTSKEQDAKLQRIAAAGLACVGATPGRTK